MYEEIKQEIDAKITTNGVGDITGKKLNETLHSMVGGMEKAITVLPQSLSNGEQKQAQANLNDTTASQDGKMGYKVLQPQTEDPTTTFAAQIANKPNTIFEIRDVFDLGGNTVTIPSNCELFFNGGKLENGILDGVDTIISADANKIFDNISFSGTFLPGRIIPQWFGAKGDGTTDNTNAFQSAFDAIGKLGNEVYIPNGDYRFNGGLTYTKTNAVIYGNNNTTLKYYGNSHFFTIGDKANSIMADNTEFRSFNIRAIDANSGDIFHIEWASKMTFRDIELTYGEMAFNTGHNDFKGFFYGYFYNVSAVWQKKNGFNIIPYGTAQVNDVHFFECRGSSAGNPTYGTHTNIPDSVNGNGFNVGGTSITILNCAAELNNGYGIKVDENTNLIGAVFEGCYFENNLMENHVLVGKGGYKGNLRIGTNYFTPSKYPVVEIQSETRISRRVTNIYETKDYFKELKTIVSRDEKYYDLSGHFNGLKIPANIAYRVKQGHGGTYCRICPGILIGGDILRIVGSDGIDARTITDISNGVVTLDSSTSANFYYVMIISEEHPLYAVPKADLISTPIPAQTLGGKYPAANGYYVPTTQGATTFTITSAMSKNNPSMKVGDIVYLYSGDFIMKYVTLTNYTEIQANLTIPSALQGSSLEKYFCACIITNLPDTSTPFDYLYGYSEN